MKLHHWIYPALVSLLASLHSTSALAADGCKFLLCVAGPWTSIPECKSTVLDVFHDLHKGKPLPTCAMSGAGNSAANHWNDSSSCPAWYRRYDAESGQYIGCSYPGRIDVYINGSPWSSVHWDTAGNSSTWYSETAAAGLGPWSIDLTFEQDKAAWEAVQPPPPLPDQGGGGGY
jgi:hypothetical protein